MPRVDFRLESGQRIYWLVVGLLWLPVAALRFAAGGIATGVAALALAAVLVATFFVAGRYGVTLTPGYLVVRGLRRRVIAWDEIRDITAANVVSSKRVAVHLADGSTTRPLAPLHNWVQPDREFDRKFSTIYDWWLGARAAMPPPPVTRRTPSSPQPPTRPVPRRSTPR